MKSIEFILNNEIPKIANATIAKNIATGKMQFSQLMDLFFSDDLRMCQKVSNVLLKCIDASADEFYPYFSEMIERLNNPAHQAYIRNTLRIWQFLDIPEEYEGVVYDLCYQYLTDIKAAAAIRIFAMTIMGNLAQKYPDLSLELINLIQLYYKDGTIAFKNRGKKIMEALPTTN